MHFVNLNFKLQLLWKYLTYILKVPIMFIAVLLVNIFNYTLFDAKTNKRDRLLTQEQVTYNWQCKKHGFSRLMPQTLNDSLCDLFVGITIVSHTGNRNCFKSNGMSVGIIGIRGIKTFFPLYFALKNCS